MPFSFLPPTLTHTGTDADCSDLSNISAVTPQSKGGKTSYYLDSTITRLEIDGDLQATAEIEEIVFDEATTTQTIQVTGLFKIGKVTTINGIVRYSKGDVITMPRHAAPHYQDNSIVVKNGGRVEWRGGTINVGDAMGCEPGGTFEVWDGRFVTTDPDNSSMFIRNDAGVDDVKVHYVELDGLYPDLGFAAVVYSLNGLNTFSAKFLAAFIQPKLGVWGAVMKLRNMSFVENANTFDAWFVGDSGQGENKVQPVELTNIDVGTGLRIVDFNNNLRIGHYSIFQEVDSNVIDGNTDLPIENAVHFVETTDNGKRINVRSDQFRGYLDFESDTYASYTTTSDVDGNFARLKILTGRLYDITLTHSNPEFDLYSETNVPGTDDYTHYFNAYGYRQSPKALILKSADVISYTSVLFPDLAITESNDTIVATYDITINHNDKTITLNSGIITPQMIYDYVEWDKVNNNIIYPTIETKAVESSDGKIFISSYRVIGEIGATLKINPETALLEFTADTDYDTLVINGGALELGVKTTINEIVSYTTGVAIKINRETNAIWGTAISGGDRKGGVIITNNGTINSYGATIQSGLPVGFGRIADEQDINGNVEQLTIEDISASYQPQTRFDILQTSQDTISFHNLILKGGGKLLIGNVKPNILQVDFLNSFLQSYADQPSKLIFKNIKFSGNANSIDFQSNTRSTAINNEYDFINIDVGTAMELDVLLNNKYQEIDFLREVNVNVSDNVGIIENAKIFIKNNNNDIFEGITNNQGILDNPLLVLMGEASVNNGNTFTKSYYSKNNDNTDIFDIKFRSYNHILKKIEVVLKGINVLEILEKLTIDEVVVEADKAVVDLYSDFEIAEEIYDVAKSWLYDNDPDADETIVTRFTSIINARAYDVVIDAAAVSLFDFVANEIILRATNLTATINTTGSINIATATTQAGGASGDVILNGTASISDGIYSKIILSNTYTPTTITLTNVTISEIENQTGNDIVINNINSTITTKTETSGRFYAEIENGIVDVGSRDVVYDTGAGTYISIAGEIITINAPTNDIQTTGIVTAVTQLTANILGDFETATPIDILAGVEITTLRITSGTDTVDISALEIITLDNATGASLFYIGEADNYIGVWAEIITLTIQLSQATDIYITDADTADVLLEFTQASTDINLQVSGVNNARITVNQVGRYAKTYDVAIVGNTVTSPNLDQIPFFDVAASVIPVITTTSGTEVIATFSAPVHITHLEMISTLDMVSTNGVSLQYLNENNESEDGYFTPTLGGIEFNHTIILKVLGDIIVTTDSFLDATYTVNPENGDNRKVTYSPTFVPVIDYSTIEKIVQENSGGEGYGFIS